MPAVIEVCRPQSRHSYKRGRLFSTAARRPLQPGQMKPSGQRRLNKNATQLASSENAFWNSESERALAIGMSWRPHAADLTTLHLERPSQRDKPLPEVATSQFVYLNTGNGWATSTGYTLPYVISNTSGSTVTYAQLANYLGNGQQYQDVLSTITYPKGGSTSATYGYTTQSKANPQLPYSLLVVTKLMNNPGIGTSAENDYSYAGGLQYLPSNVYDRKFAGFASTTNTNSDGMTVTYYSQGATSTSLGDQIDGYASSTIRSAQTFLLLQAV